MAGGSAVLPGSENIIYQAADEIDLQRKQLADANARRERALRQRQEARRAKLRRTQRRVSEAKGAEAQSRLRGRTPPEDQRQHSQQYVGGASEATHRSQDYRSPRRTGPAGSTQHTQSFY